MVANVCIMDRKAHKVCALWLMAITSNYHTGYVTIIISILCVSTMATPLYTYYITWSAHVVRAQGNYPQIWTTTLECYKHNNGEPPTLVSAHSKCWLLCAHCEYCVMYSSFNFYQSHVVKLRTMEIH